MSAPQQTATPEAGAPAGAAAQGNGPDSFRTLAVAAIGIVFGDIGTSPIYAFRETFAGHHPLAPDQLHIFGVLSLIFWSMMIVVTIKYVVIIMRADNKGEGGSLALLALINRSIGQKRRTILFVLLGVFATALFYGDAMITPAMSVLSASEGLATVDPHFGPFVIPLAVVLLIALFAIQSRGTSRVGQFFGPIMLCYFITLAGLGLMHIASNPAVLLALNPWYAIQFFLTDKFIAFLALGSVVLAVTGASALYTDMGHFGRNPIRVSWLFFVLPGLMLNYLGQGAFILSAAPQDLDAAIRNPFFLLAPEALRLPLVLLSILATIIASQAVITGAFSLTQQAIQLGFMPRLKIKHTSASAQGQIYIPLINWGLLVMVLLLVMSFKTSSNLAAAYGIAVTGVMFIDTCLLAVLIFSVWKWSRMLSIGVLAIFFLVDTTYFAANLTKVPDGGWFPLLAGLVIFTMLTTWSKGRGLMMDRLSEAAMPIPVFVASAANSAVRVQGTAVFMTSTSDGVPHALLHNLKHNKVLHERVVLLTVKVLDVPTVDSAMRFHVEDLGHGFYRLILHYGFMEEANVPAALAQVTGCGEPFRMIETSFFLTRQTLLPSARPGMPLWREKLFAWMLRNAESPMEFFRLPTNRVIELGSQLEI